jgi:hypothetical protein
VSSWSTAGLKTIAIDADDVVHCESTHLTSFSLLFDPNPEPAHALTAGHRVALTSIGYMGSAISIVGLAVTIVTYSLFRLVA